MKKTHKRKITWKKEKNSDGDENEERKIIWKRTK